MPTYPKIFAVILFCLPLWATAYALSTDKLSLSDLFGWGKNEEELQVEKTENLQSLKVLDKNFFADEIDKKHSGFKHQVEVFNTDMTAFESNKSVVDSIDGGRDNDLQTSFYTVVEGDSISTIAEYFNVSIETLVTYNKLKIKTLSVGQKLEVPTVSGILYEVKKGDTLGNIAKKYSVDVDDITLYNQIFDTSDISAGDEIFLPHAKQIENDIKKIEARSSNSLANKNSKWERGDTSHLNTKSAIKKYSSLPMYPDYYLFPSPGAVRTQKMHGQNATDLANKMGAPVISSAEGTVRIARSGSYNFGYGNYIIISHPNGTETLYAHNQTILVSPGQSVSRGQQIATIGSTGNSTGPHVHFEVRNAYNPFAW